MHSGYLDIESLVKIAQRSLEGACTDQLKRVSLKTEYRPEVDNEDFLIEDILLRSFLNDRLVDQGSKLNIDQDQMYKFHAGPMDFSVYKSYFSKLNKRRSRKNYGS